MTLDKDISPKASQMRLMKRKSHQPQRMPTKTFSTSGKLPNMGLETESPSNELKKPKNESSERKVLKSTSCFAKRKVSSHGSTPKNDSGIKTVKSNTDLTSLELKEKTHSHSKSKFNLELDIPKKIYQIPELKEEQSPLKEKSSIDSPNEDKNSELPSFERFSSSKEEEGKEALERERTTPSIRKESKQKLTPIISIIRTESRAEIGTPNYSTPSSQIHLHSDYQAQSTFTQALQEHHQTDNQDHAEHDSNTLVQKDFFNTNIQPQETSTIPIPDIIHHHSTRTNPRQAFKSKTKVSLTTLPLNQLFSTPETKPFSTPQTHPKRVFHLSSLLMPTSNHHIKGKTTSNKSLALLNFDQAETGVSQVDETRQFLKDEHKSQTPSLRSVVMKKRKSFTRQCSSSSQFKKGFPPIIFQKLGNKPHHKVNLPPNRRSSRKGSEIHRGSFTIPTKSDVDPTSVDKAKIHLNLDETKKEGERKPDKNWIGFTLRDEIKPKRRESHTTHVNSISFPK
jgi:hypothetical protein